MAPNVSRLQMPSGEYVPEKERGENDYLVISLVLKVTWVSGHRDRLIIILGSFCTVILDL